MANYEKVFKAIVAGAAGIGTIVGTNMVTKLFKVDRLNREVGAMVNGSNNNNFDSNGETIDIEFADDFATDQDVENRI